MFAPSIGARGLPLDHRHEGTATVIGVTRVS